MYQVKNNCKKKGKIEEIEMLEGIAIGSSNKTHKINGSEVKTISVLDNDLASPIANKMVLTKYQKLIEYITNILVDDDDSSGESYREALNHIEKFRLEIKNKYRDYLKKKELDMMAKQLMVLQKELNERLIQIRDSYYNMKEERRSK